MTSKFAKLRALSWPERRVLAQAMLLLPMVWTGLRLFGLPPMHSWASRATRAARTPRADVAPAALGALVGIAGRHLPFPSTCLTRSLLLAWLLNRRGERADLRIGVRMTGGALDAHAWVECDGRPVNDAPDVARRYAAFDGPLPASAFPMQ